MRYFIRRYKGARFKEVSPQLYQSMLDHMKRFPVEYEGCAVLAKEIILVADKTIPL